MPTPRPDTLPNSRQQHPQGYRPNRFNNNRSRTNNQPQCQLCGKFGHMVLSCYHRFDVNYQGPHAPASSTSQTGPTPPAQAMMAAPSPASTDSWFLDSSATHHLSHTVANIHNGTSYNGTDSVMVGNAFLFPPSSVLFPSTTSSSPAIPSELAPTSPLASFLSLPPLIQVPFVDEAAEISTASLQDSIAPIPSHPMITRSKFGIYKKKTYLTSLIAEPRTVKQVFQDPNWKLAMEQEYQALLKNQTWSLVPPPSNAKIIGCKWVFKLKHKPDGSIDRYKAQLVAQGFHQTYGIDFFETFSPVVKPCTIRLVLSIVVSSNWPIKQLDVHNAFLNGDL
ncbi:hypothetical protein VitviT2T_008211 [Vitis vinifera]|uniref:Reverse transcriptase Ty1/copia-type domain-containing protein n=1 Tax=Vitis vinifera TaxID=29760 RepID=A0ABY9C1U2_VITVI|nr:hypothetical protein VitviT2T_008211 [Vitis vinifera]